MSLDRCLLLARCDRADDRERLARRIERLALWHGGTASWAWVGEHGAAGVVRYDERREDLAKPVVFGEALPAAVAAPREAAAARPLLDAPPESLRAIDGAAAALEVAETRACLVAGAGGPGVLYAASSEGIDAWSTHAVAAAWLAHGRARVDPAVIPEQLAAEFVGGGRSLIEGARPLGQALRVTVGDDGARTEDFWPVAERWAPVPEEDAAAHAERHLLLSLERRVAPGTYASLTAGLDSRVVAVALRELGIDAQGFTWGEADWDDVLGGAGLASAVDIPHSVVSIEWLPDEDARAEVQRQVRWNEGAIHVGFARLAWPPGMPAFVTGAGGETGRAFYYRDRAPASEAAGHEELARTLDRLLEPRLAGAPAETLEALRESVRGWIAAAAEAGPDGWRTLDVVYGEQRVRRWLRGMLPRLDAPMIPAFATPEVGRALASLPLDQRLSDGFHRGFLERHAPDLVPAASIPRRRSLRDRLPGRFRGRPGSSLAERWHGNPEFREWVGEAVLGSPLVTQSLGEDWAARTRERFFALDGEAEGLALAAGGPVALAEALAELGPDE